jgi:hypothetical protein
MRRLLAPLAALSICVAWSVPAGASGDFGCSPSWRLRHGDLSGCDNMVMLAPGNDTRVNLLLLLSDRRGVPPMPGKPAPSEQPSTLFEWRTFADWLEPNPETSDTSYSSGEGSRCLSNDSGTEAFIGAVNAAKLPGGEHDALIAARQGLHPDCARPGESAAIAALDGQVKSPAGKGFAIYLQGAAAFYGGDFDTASARFGNLHDVRVPWLRETSRYMLARVEVNRAQVDLFDEYGNPKDFKTIDPKPIAAADADIHAYLKDFPSGTYAASAEGLLRRVYWFGNNRSALAAQYVSLFDRAPAKRGIGDVDLAEEIDNKLLPQLTAGDTSDPTMLAVLDLQQMRMDEGKVDAKAAISLDQINAQRGMFAKAPALFEFLIAAHTFYVGKKPADVLRLIPDAARQSGFSGVQFSRQMLRGMALEAVGDRNARGFWLEMLPGATLDSQHLALELALAWHDERAGALGRVFAADSVVNDATMREILLTNVADAALLRQQVKGAKVPHEREVALFTLLYKELSRGAYRDFGNDIALVPANAPADGGYYGLIGSDHPPVGVFNSKTLGDYDCPALKVTASKLAAAPRDWHAQLCLADFFRANGFDGIGLDTQPSNTDLGGTPTLFAGPVYSRLDVYKRVVADNGAAAGDKAYALFRAINCYGPSGNNSCGGTEVSKAQRKAWFQQLKTSYGTTSWARELQYYW